MRKTREGAEQTRQDLLTAAFEVFMEEGYEGASLEKICSRAHVTRGAAYWHFKNKRDLYHQTLRQIVQRTEALRNRIVTDATLSLPQKLTELLWIPHEHAEIFEFVGRAADHYLMHPELEEVGEEIQRGEQRFYWYLLTELSTWEQPACSVEHLATILYTFFLGLYTYPKTSSIPKNVGKDVIENFVGMVLDKHSHAVLS